MGGVAVSKAQKFGQPLELIRRAVIKPRQRPLVLSSIESRLAGRALEPWWAFGAEDGWICSESIAGIDLARVLASVRPIVRGQLRRRCRTQDAEKSDDIPHLHLLEVLNVFFVTETTASLPPLPVCGVRGACTRGVWCTWCVY